MLPNIKLARPGLAAIYPWREGRPSPAPSRHF